MYVLVPTEVPDLFTLEEILNWVAFKGLPLGHDLNIDDEMFEHSRTSYPEELYEEGYQGSLEGKLPLYPDYPDYPSPQILEYIPGLPENFKERAIAVHKEHERELKKWQAAYDEIAEIAQAEIFLALKQGRLQLKGVLVNRLPKDAPADGWKQENGDSWEEVPRKEYPYPSPRESMHVAMREGNIDAFECHSSATDWKMALHARHRFEARLSDIPAQVWRQEGIDWQNSNARTPEGWFEEIVGPAKNIFECFPLPPRVSVSMDGCAGYLLEPDRRAGARKEGKRGRPPLVDWHAFDVEVARVISQEGLPVKQEAFISEMQDWCEGQGGTRPKRSTVLQRVSPFYQIAKGTLKVRK